ncbi:MAG: hypothetical protein KC877_02585 [Candidatus Kaiserbacteria bacterium]|nr:hypothetical protein [Candidatus Kaiserbacteria bacterium]MCB9816329.1 hypothetical protein [Candidatus Nomurabacteria bacterium]
MRYSSFHATPGSLFDQCLRTVDHYRSDLAAGFPGKTQEEKEFLKGLKPLMVEQTCFTSRDKYEHPEKYSAAEQCYWETVPDEIVFLYMNGLINGHHGVTELVEKLLGREDKALICPLGEGLFSYWFRDDPGKSCNNAGFTYDPPKPPPPAPTPPVEPECRIVATGQPINGDHSLHLPSQVLGCCCTDDQYIPSFDFRIEDTVNMPQQFRVICD